MVSSAEVKALALAEEPIKLTVGGFFKTAYMVVFDDDDEDGAGELGPGIAIDGEIGCTWVEIDSTEPDDEFLDGYDGLELGIGTSFTF